MKTYNVVLEKDEGVAVGFIVEAHTMDEAVAKARATGEFMGGSGAQLRDDRSDPDHLFRMYKTEATVMLS